MSMEAEFVIGMPNIVRNRQRLSFKAGKLVRILWHAGEMNPFRYSSCWQNVYDCILPDYSKKK